MKNILFTSYSKPELMGYHDKVSVITEDDTNVIYHSAASCCPNPTSPKTNKPWAQTYGFIDFGDYKGKCIEHDVYKKCIILNNGGRVPCRIPNVNHDNQKIMSEVFIHSGQSEQWRGSAGCLTLPPSDYKEFIKLFDIGEKATIKIIDYTKNERSKENG